MTYEKLIAQPYFLVSILFAIISVAVFISFIFLVIRYFGIRKQYKSIIDVDLEVNNRKKSVEELERKLSELKNELDKNEQLAKNLKTELASLEEDQNLISCGVYKPHFEFKTSDEYKKKINEIYELRKQIIRDEKAIVCGEQWTVSGSKSEGMKMTRQNSKLMLRAFNGEVDSALAKVRWNNMTTMRERIQKAFDAINRFGAVLTLSISDSYLKYRLQELDLTYEYEEKLNQEKEEQRRIREQMREEEKVRQEIEKAEKEAEEDELRYQKALEKAKVEIESAKGKEVESLNEKISLLEQKLAEARQLKERAISRAQITKSGHVYIISNIGSLGENVYKIGMTRRLEPTDRIKELSGASVPFEFDIHAMIYSDNAPELEKIFHDHFDVKRVNLINPRKEFFNVLIDEIEQVCKEKNIKIELTKIAEAREHRETLEIRKTKSKQEGILINEK